jgi:acylphosphatase
MSEAKQQPRTVHVRIEGRVQGVYYRAWAKENADQLGLDGWVRNRADGSVEAVFSGPPEAVAEMLARCRRGPRDAKVDAVHVLHEGGSVAAGFEIRPTV